MNTAGLSLEQAPPLAVPFAFFLVAPAFAMLAGAMLFWQGDMVLLSRWTPPALAVTHLLALGFLTQVMCGALFQMLPVLAGSPVPRVVLVGVVTQILLVAGTLSLCVGFQWGGAFWLMLGGSSLSLGLLCFMFATGIALVRAHGVPRTVLAMRLALAGLLMTLLLGGMLLATLMGVRMPGVGDWVNLHLGWGLLGWVGMLILGVGYQVVPMFHVTPAYPAWLTRAAAPLILLGLTVATGLTALGQGRFAVWGFAGAVVVFVAFAVVTLDRQRRRERPRIDATLLHWWSAMLAAILAAGLWALGGHDELLGVLLLVGVGVGLPSGMLFKIMPFLSWFHLQHRQVATKGFDIRLPHMQSFLPDTLARLQFGLHAVMLLCLIAATTVPGFVWSHWFARIGGLALILSSAVLWWLQARCYLRFRQFSRRLG